MPEEKVTQAEIEETLRDMEQTLGMLQSALGGVLKEILFDPEFDGELKAKVSKVSLHLKATVKELGV